MLGIFQHKKEEYNKLILKSLAFGPKTTKQIAEYVYHNRKGKLKNNMANEVKTLVSIISRKGSRLEELESKQYIFRENSLWYGTTKGTAVSLTLFNSVSEIFPYLDMNGVVAMIEKPTLHVIKQLERSSLLRASSTKQQSIAKRAKKFLEFAKTIEFVQVCKDYTSELINQGVDLDKMSNDAFSANWMGKWIYHFSNKEIAQLSRAISNLEDVKP